MRAWQATYAGSETGRIIVTLEFADLAAFARSEHAYAKAVADPEFDYPDVPDWRNSHTGTIEAWKAFADNYSIYYPPEAQPQRVIANVQKWLQVRDRGLLDQSVR